jgi:GNAT superfamily N-acetyltransferase
LIIRPFDGTLDDARGIIEVDGATFGDCHYAPEYIVDLESDPEQYAWVAVDEGRVAGFVSAFPTHSLAASRWEVDELAVHPAMQGKGLGTALVARAVEQGARVGGLSETRALVAANNVASRSVFMKNGYRSRADVDLLLYEVTGRVPRPRRPGLPSVRSARAADAARIAALSGCPLSRVAVLLRQPGNIYLVAGREGEQDGFLELIHVRTLQYEGFWIESLCVAGEPGDVVRALLNAAIEEAKCHEQVGEVGYLVPPDRWRLYESSVGEGFKKVNAYQVFTQRLGGR